MIATALEQSQGLTFGEREARRRGRWDAEMEEEREARQREEERESSQVKKVSSEGSRWEFRIREVSVIEEGRGRGRGKEGNDWRGEGGVGWRYGAPLMDRKKATVKIPTSVEA